MDSTAALIRYLEAFHPSQAVSPLWTPPGLCLVSLTCSVFWGESHFRRLPTSWLELRKTPGWRWNNENQSEVRFLFTEALRMVSVFCIYLKPSVDFKRECFSSDKLLAPSQRVFLISFGFLFLTDPDIWAAPVSCVNESSMMFWTNWSAVWSEVNPQILGLLSQRRKGTRNNEVMD